MKNTLIFDADNNITLCLEIVKTDENELTVEAKADSFTDPRVDIRNNGGTYQTETLTKSGDIYIYAVPVSRWIGKDIETLEIRIRCNTSGACSEWVRVNTVITDTAKNVLLNQVSDKEFTTSASTTDELQISGRNYIVNSGKAVTLVGKGLETQVTNNGIFYPSVEVAKSLEGKRVTVTFDYENNVTEGECTFRRMYSWGLICRFSTEQNTGSGSYTLTFTLTKQERTAANAFYLQGKFSGTVTVKNIKLELGNKYTDWSVAPEDVVRLEERVSALEATILSLGAEVAAELGEETT